MMNLLLYQVIYLMSPMPKLKPLFMLFLLAVLSMVSFAAPPQANDVFQLKASVIDPNTLLLNWQVKSGFFLYADRIKLDVPEDANLHSNIFRMPEAEQKTDLSGKSYPVYRKNLEIPVAVLASEPGEPIIRIHYQGCADDGFCYAPQTRDIRLSINDQNELVAAQILKKSEAADTTAQTTEKSVSAEETVFSKSFFIIILSFFGFGLLLSFTPCVLPMIPVLSGIIVGHGKDISTRKAFLLSLSYVLSMALTYALVGAVVAELGANLQIIMQSAWVVIIFSMVFVLLSLSMFDLYELKMPMSWQAKMAQATRSQSSGHYLSAAIMGSLSTLILSPCVTAPLIGALSYIAHSGDLLLGSLALFFLGLGMGVPLLLIGASAGKLLPKAGIWMNAVKHFFGYMLLGMAIYLLDRILPGFISMLLWSALFIFAGLFHGALDFRGEKPRLSQGLGIMMLVYGLLILIGASMGSINPVQPLKPLVLTASTEADKKSKQTIVPSLASFEQSLKAASGKPVMLDFYADWCRSCKTMESSTFQNPKIKQAMSDLVVFKADITANNAKDQQLLKHFNVVAPPTFLFFDKHGREIESLRITGEIDAEQLLGKLQRYQDYFKESSTSD